MPDIAEHGNGLADVPSVREEYVLDVTQRNPNQIIIALKLGAIMRFIAVLTNRTGLKVVHEFRSNLIRARFLKTVRMTEYDPQFVVRIKLLERPDKHDVCPPDEAHWYSAV